MPNNPLNLPQLIPELYCTNIKESLNFYIRTLSFSIAYQREEDGFAMLERQGSFLMLDEIVENSKRSWVSGPLEKPFGRGINFSIETTEIDALYENLLYLNIPIFLPIENKWYRANDIELGSRQFIVLDLDGYMLRFTQELGQRPHASN
ncbi:MAG TPA: hypothetical protein DD400_02395 [Rhodospirillaceae bacterium]|nr:hypothetical protein [Rhodospirillaceae bacterium]